jgi:hypothetical protein
MSDFDDMHLPGASLRFYEHGPAWDGVPSVALGALAFESGETGAALLREATARAGGRPVLAPMDGDTWHAYRTVVESDGSPPFLMEPAAHPHVAEALALAGFSRVADYVSTIMALDTPQGLPAPVEGVTVASWDGQNAQPLLEQVFAFAGGSFADKQFFKPITREAFLALYLPLLPLLDPRLVFLAHDADGAVVGFLLGYRDPAVPTRAVLKTYAGARRGIGHLLASRFHDAARALGCTQVIHALMHADNISLVRSGQHGAEVFRRYALFGHRAAPA